MKLQNLLLSSALLPASLFLAACSDGAAPGTGGVTGATTTTGDAVGGPTGVGGATATATTTPSTATSTTAAGSTTGVGGATTTTAGVTTAAGGSGLSADGGATSTTTAGATTAAGGSGLSGDGGATSTTVGTGGSAAAATGGAGGTGGTGNSTVECNLPDLPDGNSLTYENHKLPDPFTFYDGTKVTTKAQWECRRKEILAMAAKYLYGPVPPEPDEVTGTVSGNTVTINVTAGSNSDTFSVSLSGSGDVIALKLSGGIFPSNSRSLSFGSGFETKIRNLFGLSELNTNIANGWMIDRVMDVLEQNPDSGLDPTKVMVSGCSGCGKGAYLAGVFSRAPVVVIVESGGGGVANLRQAEWFRHGDGKAIWQCADDLPQSIDNLEDNGICGPWVSSAAQWLRSNPSKVWNLPFDTHLLLATIAPRYLVHFSNNNGVNSWCHLGGTCEALSSWAAKPVWHALGVPERMGFHMYSANHCGASGDQTALATEMFKRAFDGDTTANTDVMEIMDDGVQQPVSEWKDMWIDWDMETVLQ